MKYFVLALLPAATALSHPLVSSSEVLIRTTHSTSTFRTHDRDHN